MVRVVPMDLKCFGVVVVEVAEETCKSPQVFFLLEMTFPSSTLNWYSLSLKYPCPTRGTPAYLTCH